MAAQPIVHRMQRTPHTVPNAGRIYGLAMYVKYLNQLYV